MSTPPRALRSATWSADLKPGRRQEEEETTAEARSSPTAAERAGSTPASASEACPRGDRCADAACTLQHPPARAAHAVEMAARWSRIAALPAHDAADATTRAPAAQWQPGCRSQQATRRDDAQAAWGEDFAPPTPFWRHQRRVRRSQQDGSTPERRRQRQRGTRVTTQRQRQRPPTSDPGQRQRSRRAYSSRSSHRRSSCR